MADKYIRVADFRERFGIPNDGTCRGCPHFHYHKSCLHGDLCDALDDLPAATVRPVVPSEWERPEGVTPRSWVFRCKQCGNVAYWPVPKNQKAVCGYPLCPFCGANMKGSENA